MAYLWVLTMIKRLFAALALIVLLPLNAGAAMENGVPAFSGKLRSEIKKINHYAGKQNYKAAQNAIGRVLKAQELSEKQRKYIEEIQRRVTVQELFSHLPDVIESYNIQPGDALHKIAKKHDTTAELIKYLSGLHSDKILTGRKLRILKHPLVVKVDKSENALELILDGTMIKRYRVATGANNNTPVGEFKIIEKLENPTWYKPGGVVVVPNSPENGLGTRWMGFNEKSYGIHGTNEPESIGRQVSHGCIRLLNREAEELFSILPTGTKVIVQD